MQRLSCTTCSARCQAKNRKVSIGDDVFEAEFIRTKAESTANILLVDKTSVLIGSNAALKLDRIDLNEDQSFKAMELNFPNGPLRWISGTSPSSAYEVKTPQAVIHATAQPSIFWSTPSGHLSCCRRGQLMSAPPARRSSVRTLSRRGDMITVTPRALDGPRPGPSDFAGPLPERHEPEMRPCGECRTGVAAIG